MPKRRLTPAQAFDLRQALHVATLDALMAWPLSGEAVQSMVQSAITSLDEGIRAMRRIEAQSRAKPAGSSP